MVLWWASPVVDSLRHWLQDHKAQGKCQAAKNPHPLDTKDSPICIGISCEKFTQPFEEILTTQTYPTVSEIFPTQKYPKVQTDTDGYILQYIQLYNPTIVQYRT